MKTTHVDLSDLPDNARLWVYQSTRAFTSEEKIRIDLLTTQFTSQWQAHGQPLKSAFRIFYDQFLVIAVDESQALATGCSIDSSVNLIRSIEREFGLSLLDRTQVAMLSGERIRLLPFNGIKKEVEAGNILADTILFNNAVSNLKDWKENWRQPAGQSWAKRFFS